MRHLISKSLLSLSAALLLVAATTSPAIAKTTQDFEAVFTGFLGPITDVGDSPIFITGDFGSGVETNLGSFDFSSTVYQNLARIPEKCTFEENSSSAVNGMATLEFASGNLFLKRTSGSACFTVPPPLITISETWVITSGTGIFRGASGVLTREFVGDLSSPPPTIEGTLSGTISLLD